MNAPAAPLPFQSEVETYLQHYRALGYRYRGHACTLSRLGRYLETIGAEDLDAAGYERWCRSISHNHPNSRRKAQQIVRRFCVFRARSEPTYFVPNVYTLTKLQPYVRPVIVAPDQIARMLTMASTLTDRYEPPLRAAVNRIAVVLLYTTGLRVGELLRLEVTDILDGMSVLQIRESKFHKSRLVPLSQSVQSELRLYLRARGRRYPQYEASGPLLCNRFGGTLHVYSKPGLTAMMKRLFDLADVRDAQGRRPRLHDMRHSYAIQALIRVYRARGDVQSALPKLALFMGHVSVASTLHYLHLVPEIAALASQRFEGHFGHWIDGGAS